MLKCNYIEELIQAFIDGEITKKEEDELKVHLKECANCQKSFEVAKKSKNIIVNNIVEEELPPYFEAKLWKRIENETQERGIFIPKRWVPRIVSAIGVVIAVVVLFHTSKAPAPEIYVVSPLPHHVVAPEDAIVSAAFYNKPKEGSISLVINGKTLTPLVELRDDHMIYTPEEPLKEGYYKVSVQIRDKNGKIQREKEWLFYVLP